MNAQYLLLFAGVAGLAISAPAKDPATTGKELDGWGTTIDPAGDCRFTPTGSKLTITVPGTAAAHDLSTELNSSTAPRVLQTVTGDFTLQVKVDGFFLPGGESTQEGRTGYTGAGLVVFADENNFVRLERASLQRQGGDAVAYTNFEIRVGGQLQKIGTTADLPTEPDKPTWLRLERKGDTITGSMSHDGVVWKSGEPKQLSEDAWQGPAVKVGVAAISTSRFPFAPEYTDFSVTKAKAAEAAEKAEPEAATGEATPEVEPEKR